MIELTQAQAQRVGRLQSRGGRIGLYEMPDTRAVLAVVYSAGDIVWFEVLEEVPTHKLAWDTGARPSPPPAL